MKMDLNALAFYEVVIETIVIYMTFPKDQKQRDEAYSKFIMSWISHNTDSSTRAKHLTSFPVHYAALMPLSDEYKHPNKGYSFEKLAIVGNLLITLFRLDASNLTVSINNAYGYTLAMNNINKLSKNKLDLRRLKAYWAEYRSVAHIALTFLLHQKNEVTRNEYPNLIASIYILQEKYKKIIRENSNFSFEIWELPDLENLKWSDKSQKIPTDFLKQMNIKIDVQPFDDKDIKFLNESKKYVREINK